MRRSIILFTLVAWFFSFSAVSQTLTYPPLCSNGGQVNPITTGFTGGFYNISPAAGQSFMLPNGGIDLPNSIPGTYIVQNTGSSCGCTVTQTVVIYEAVLSSVPDIQVCAYSSTPSLLVVPNTTLGIASYSWLPSNATTQNLTLFQPFFGQTYTLQTTDINGCVSQSSGSINVIAVPSIVILPTPAATICPNGTVTLKANGASPPVLWSTGATAATIAVSPSVTTTYYVSDSINGCPTSTNIVVKVVNVNITISPPSPTVCAGRPTTLTVASTPTANFIWYPGQSAGSTHVISPTAPQTYTVKTTIPGPPGGCPFTKTISVGVSPSYTPFTQFSYPFPLCNTYSDQLPILATGFAGGGTFSISPAAGGGFVNTTGLVRMDSIVPGSYVVYYKTATAGCTVATNFGALLTVGQTGQVEVVPDVIVYKGSSATLSVSGGSYYQWSPAEFISCVNCDAPDVFPPESMQYCVTSDLCIDGACVNVTVLCKNPGDLSVPNAFTPDGDGRNDKFCLQGWDQCCKKFEILIFDRWGEKIFTSHDPTFCWDGKFNGKVLDAGVYTYAITASYELAPRVDKRGTITILDK